MAMYEVEVEGRYTAVIEVEADSPEEAENEAIRAFESDYDVVYSMGADSWDYTGICGVEHLQEDEED